MDTIKSIFTREVRPEIRALVLEALTTQDPIQHHWLTDKKGCLMAVATAAAKGISLNQFRRAGDFEQQAADVLGISRKRVNEGYTEWDGLTPRNARLFITELKLELETYLAAQKRSAREQRANFGIMSRAIQKTREFITA